MTDHALSLDRLCAKKKRAAVAARGWDQEQPVDQNAPEADRRNVPDDVIGVSDGEVDQDSSQGDESRCKWQFCK